MRLFYFLLLSFLALPAWSQNCTDLSVASCTTLKIDNAIEITPVSGAPAIFVEVFGDVEINADITIDGGDGRSITNATNIDDLDGGLGGPGAEDGGGIAFGEGEPQFGGTYTGSGVSAPTDPVCSNGGGGAGFKTVGTRGDLCVSPTSTTSRGAAGQLALAAEFDFPTPFRGGFGGGAGGADATGGGFYALGSGGGGGGALHILAHGKITIKNGVHIYARGGNGGNATAQSGGGGGGSGGVIWLEATGEIINNGILNVNPGEGGKNNSTGAHGGNGGKGVWRLESIAGVSSGSNVLDSSNTRSNSSLKSDISCGTIGKANEKKTLYFQMMLGFLLALALGELLKKKTFSFIKSPRFSSKNL